MRPQGSRLPVAPTLCLEQLEERRLLNGAPWWAAPLAGASHEVDVRSTGHHASADPGQASTGATLGDLKHNAVEPQALAKHIKPDSASSEIAAHVAHASDLHARGPHARSRANDPGPSPTAQLLAASVNDKEHGQPTTGEGKGSPTGQLIAALKHDGHDGADSASVPDDAGPAKGPPAVSNPGEDSSHTGWQNYSSADGSSPSAGQPVANNAPGGDNSPSAQTPYAYSGDDSAGSSSTGDSKSGGSTDQGNSKSGKKPGATGSGGSHSNGNGNGGSKTGGHKGSGKSGGSQGSTHQGGGHGVGSPSGGSIGQSGQPDLAP